MSNNAINADVKHARAFGVHVFAARLIVVIRVDMKQVTYMSIG